MFISTPSLNNTQRCFIIFSRRPSWWRRYSPVTGNNTSSLNTVGELCYDEARGWGVICGCEILQECSTPFGSALCCTLNGIKARNTPLIDRGFISLWWMKIDANSPWNSAPIHHSHVFLQQYLTQSLKTTRKKLLLRLRKGCEATKSEFNTGCLHSLIYPSISPT